MKILLGLTGSVASTLYEKLITQLSVVGTVESIVTHHAKNFIDLSVYKDHKLHSDYDEWSWRNNIKDDLGFGLNYRYNWEKGDRILHIELRDTASALVIAPCSANTLAKLANGLCDNLLTCVARAWDFNRPLIIAPAMNTYMWEHPITQKHIAKLRSWGAKFVMPQSKMLACKTEGMGAMADIDKIVIAVQESLRWYFPLAMHANLTGEIPLRCPGIPIKSHPGSFLHKRKHHTHTGVDLYCDDGDTVKAVENGKVVGIEDFTGVKQKTPWWEDTQCILVEGATGVICYGEVIPGYTLKVGDKVQRGRTIGHVKRVLKIGERKLKYPGHSESMLHMEIYPHGKYMAFEELGTKPDSFDILIDPTPYLRTATGAPKAVLTYEPKTSKDSNKT